MQKLIKLDVNEFAEPLKAMRPWGDFDSKFVFYYDETNNIRKFFLKKSGFNSPFDSNFVLGGIVCEENCPDIKDLFNGLNLQSSIKEVKLIHIAKGEFLECLKSTKLTYFLKYLVNSKLFIHYLNLNILYYSIVDIVDSAIVNLNVHMKLDRWFIDTLKNDLFKLCKIKKETVANFFYRYQYPNIKKESILSFIKELVQLFEVYEDTQEFHLGLTSLKQILKESERHDSLPFIMDEDDFILLKDFSGFYLEPIYKFKNSLHIFDNEVTIQKMLSQYEFNDGDKVIKPYRFEDSTQNLLIQTSDVITGLVGKLTRLINTSIESDIDNLAIHLNETQKINLGLYFDLVHKSEKRNDLFLQNIVAQDDYKKMKKISEINNLY